MNTFEVTFLGTNGSCAYNSGKRTKYGTNSNCVAVRAGNETLIFDSGTGICGFNELADYQRDHVHILYSHYHADHVSGLLFLPDFFNLAKKFSFYGTDCEKSEFGGGTVRETLNAFLQPPLSPVGFSVFSAALEFNQIKAGDVINISDEVVVSTCNLSHPGGAIAYRVEYDGKAFCYCVDVELANHKSVDDKLREITKDADLLVMDSFFDDGKVIPDWGHSSWQECTNWAKLVSAKRLALYHHNFRWTDEQLDKIETRAKEQFTGAFSAGDFMKVVL
jgi:phosphoribosyl 1,2-cyclic phosphodiesterase